MRKPSKCRRGSSSPSVSASRRSSFTSRTPGRSSRFARNGFDPGLVPEEVPPRRRVEDDAARTFLRLAAALDRRSRARDGTRLAPWNLDPVRLAPLTSWAEIGDAFERLRRLTRREPRGFRRDWLEDHLPTFRALIRQVRGPAPPLPRQVRDFYDLPTRPAGEEELDSLRREVRRLLHVGREDGLRPAVELWEQKHRVAGDAVLPTMERYLRLARRDARGVFKPPQSEPVRQR